MADHALAPLEGVATVVAGAVEQLAEVHVEIAQEGVHAVHVRQCDAQVAPVFLRPLLEREHLRVAQPGAQRLAGLQVLVRHGAHGPQPQLLGEQHVAGAGELAAGVGAQALLQRLQQFAVPFAREAPARAVVGDLQVRVAGRLQQRDLVQQALASLRAVEPGRGVAEVDLADDGQHRDLEHDGVQPRAAHADVDLAVRLRLDGDVLLVQPEQAQEIDEIALDETHRAHVVQLVVHEAQTAELADLAADLVDVGRELHPGRAALVLVFHLRTRKLVQHGLHHGELVQVGIEQALDDHDGVRVVFLLGLLARRCGGGSRASVASALAPATSAGADTQRRK